MSEVNYPTIIGNKAAIKQALLNRLGTPFRDCSNVKISELLHDIRVSNLEYEGSNMHPDVITAWQFLHFNPMFD